MPKLDDEQKRFVARRNACRIRPATIKIEFKEEFNLNLSSAQISDLDAYTAHGKRSMGEELATYFWEERAAYEAEVAKAPLNDLNHRQALRWDLLMNSAVVASSPKMALEIIESGAKDAGGQFLRDAAPKKKTGAPGEEDDDGEGEGDDDANSEATERAGRVNSLLHTARTRRDGEAASQRRTGPPPAESEETSGDTGDLQE